MIETLFICNPANSAPPKEPATRRPVLPTPKTDNKVLAPKKSQNIAILLRALNVSKEQVCDALCEGEEHDLSLNLLITILPVSDELHTALSWGFF